MLFLQYFMLLRSTVPRSIEICSDWLPFTHDIIVDVCVSAWLCIKFDGAFFY